MEVQVWQEAEREGSNSPLTPDMVVLGAQQDVLAALSSASVAEVLAA